MEGCGLRDEPCFKHPCPVREVERGKIRRCNDLHIAPIGRPARDSGKNLRKDKCLVLFAHFSPRQRIDAFDAFLPNKFKVLRGCKDGLGALSLERWRERRSSAEF